MQSMKYLEIFKYLLVGVAAVVVLITSWEDIRERKIRNKWLLSGIYAAIVIHVLSALSILVFFSGTNLVINVSYYGKMLLNIFCATVVAVALWKLTIWSAGDSKLFIALSIIYPIDYYNKGFMDFFPSSALLINIFAVSLAGMLVHTLVTVLLLRRPGKYVFDIKIKNAMVTTWEGIKKGWAVFFVTFGIFNLVFLCATLAREKADTENYRLLINLGIFTFAFVVLAPVTRKLQTLFEENKNLQYASVAALVLLMAAVITLYPPAVPILVRNAKTIAIFMATLGVALKLLMWLVEKTESNKESEGDTAPEADIQESPQQKPAPEADIQESPQQEPDPDSESDAMRHLPFAPFALAGVILTLIFKCSIIHLLLSFRQG